MIRLNLAWWCWITSTLDAIRTIAPGDAFPEAYAKLQRDALVRIWASYQSDAAIQLRVSADSAFRLLDLAARITQNPERAEPITAQESAQLREAVIAYKLVYEAELSTVDAYAVKAKGIYSTQKLIDEADAILSIEARQHLDERAAFDLREAGKCLAFELPTAAGFHVARATESAMCSLLLAKQCALPRERNWGNYIKLLQGAKVDVRITHHLRQIKDLHRNPLIHPEITLNMEDALALWSVCVSAIVSMLAVIRENAGELPEALGPAEEDANEGTNDERPSRPAAGE